MTSVSSHHRLDRMTPRAPWLGPEQGKRRGNWHGWVASLLLHALGIWMASLLVASLRLAPQPDPFRWNVAVTEPSLSPQSTERVAQPIQPITPDRPAAAPTPSTHAVRPSPTPAPNTTLAKVQEPVQAPMPPSNTPTQPVRQQQVETVSPPPAVPATQPMAMQSTPPPTAAPVERTETHVADPIQAAVAPPLQEPKAPIASVQPTPTPAPSAPPTPIMSEPEVTATAPPATTAVADAAPVAPNLSQAGLVQPTTAAASPSAPDQVASLPPTDQPVSSPVPAPKADYSWLAQSLLTTVTDNLRYPTDARLNRWEGKVVVKLIVTANGDIESVSLARSSGHDSLDKEALALLQRLSPLRLDRPLGKDRVTLQIPIRYSLR